MSRWNRAAAAVLAGCCGVVAFLASLWTLAWFTGGLCEYLGEGNSECEGTYPIALALLIPIAVAVGGVYAGIKVAATGERRFWLAAILAGVPCLIACLIALWIERDNIF